MYFFCCSTVVNTLKHKMEGHGNSLVLLLLLFIISEKIIDISAGLTTFYALYVCYTNTAESLYSNDF